MAFYRNNIGRAQQVIRVVVGAAVVVLGLVMLPAPWGWLAAAAGIGMALTGFIGWCPACAVAGIGKRGRS
jgi:hypothetical protein